MTPTDRNDFLIALGIIVLGVAIFCAVVFAIQQKDLAMATKRSEDNLALIGLLAFTAVCLILAAAGLVNLLN